MRGAAVTLTASLESLDGWRPDVVMVSDMVDIAHFRTLAQPSIDDTPIALYFHESQLTYPDPPGALPDDSYALTNWMSVLSADRVFLKSGYHRDDFFQSQASRAQRRRSASRTSVPSRSWLAPGSSVGRPSTAVRSRAPRHDGSWCEAWESSR